MQRIFQFVNHEDTQKQVQVYLLDPLINHIMERVFPYIVLTCVLFVLLLIVVMLTLGIIIFQLRKGSVITPASVLSSPFPGSV
jgi:hypothetical protein